MYMYMYMYMHACHARFEDLEPRKSEAAHARQRSHLLQTACPLTVIT